MNYLDTILMLQGENTAQNISYKKNSYNTQNIELSTFDGLAIYSKAISKIRENTISTQPFVDIYLKNHKALRPESMDLKKNAQLQIIELCSKNKAILAEFIKNFSVVHDEVAKDLMILLLKRFEYMSTELDMFLINYDSVYLNNVVNMSDRCLHTFSKMLSSISNNNQNPDNIAN